MSPSQAVTIKERAMSRHGTEWAIKARKQLILDLGGKCVSCGTKRMLEVDHINGRNWTPRNVSSDTRVRRYLKESKEGKLQVLCKSCNSAKGDYDQPGVKWMG